MLTKKSEPQVDIEIQDKIGRVQFTNVSSRQLAVLYKLHQIQQLVKSTPNDSKLGEEVRRLLVGQ
jgi:hypothetical protein